MACHGMAMFCTKVSVVKIMKELSKPCFKGMRFIHVPAPVNNCSLTMAFTPVYAVAGKMFLTLLML